VGAVVGVVALHLHVPDLVELRRVGEDLVDGCLEAGGVEDPVYEHGVGVRDDDAVNGALVVQYERQQIRHSSGEGDGHHHTADRLRADLLVSWVNKLKELSSGD